MSGHTQFPWRAERMSCQKDTHLYNYEVVNDQRSIAILLTERDAKLLAAAPELLAACEQLLESADRYWTCEELVKRAEAAIKKAKGVDDGST